MQTERALSTCESHPRSCAKEVDRGKENCAGADEAALSVLALLLSVIERGAADCRRGKKYL